MLWLLHAARRLRERGVLGINRRNACYILDHNPRGEFPLVDNKLMMRDLCVRIGAPTPQIYAVLDSYGKLKRLRDQFDGREEFVLKPNRGSAGRGILVIAGRQGDDYLRHNGQTLPLDELRQHCSDTLSGMYSLGGHPDEVLVQQRVLVDPVFEAITWQGIPDVRVIMYKQRPAMAMLRLPTRASGGRANLHQGGIGVGIDLATGVTHHAVLQNRSVERHIDTGASLLGVQVPCWPSILEMSCRVAQHVKLGYLGVDIVLDAKQGPMLLEANARPGLAIQIANAQGLALRLDAIDGEVARETTPAAAPAKPPTYHGV